MFFKIDKIIILNYWHIGKNPDSGKDWGQEEEGTTEDEIVGWYHWLSGHESEQTLGDGEGQGSLACCSPQGHKVMTEKMNKRNSKETWCSTKKLKLLSES